MRTCPECQTSYEDEVLHCPEDGFNLTGVEPVDEMIGRTVGSYKVTKPLGKGGMGAVYAGFHPVIGSRVAIKFLHPQYSTDAKIVERFFNEARAVNIIGHDNVLKILDLNVTDDNRHYFVMEYLQGHALQHIVQPDRPVDLDTTGPILLQTCNALQAAHGKGIIHRDLKPDNLYLITLNGRANFVKVVDFGIAKLTDADGASTGKTQTGMVMGTPAYMSPEQGSGETSKIDARSDIYSLGVMMYQMATGKLPFPGSNFGEVLMGHLQKTPEPPRDVVPEIQEDYEAVILKCLEKKQDDRYSSMAELHDAIFDVMQAHGISSELPFCDETTEMPPLAIGGTPSNPGKHNSQPSRPRSTTPPRSPSGPPRQPGANTAAARTGKPSPRPAGQKTGAGKTKPPEEKKSNLGMILGIAAAVVVIGGGGVGYAMHASSMKATEEARVAAEKKHKEKLASEAAAADATAAADDAAKNERVFLSVVSDPSGATVDATWAGGGKRHGTAPFTMDVPKNTKVHFEYLKDNYAPFSTEVIADQPQAVNAVLKANAVAQQGEGDKPELKKKPGKKTVDEPVGNDGLMDLSGDLNK